MVKRKSYFFCLVVLSLLLFGCNSPIDHTNEQQVGDNFVGQAYKFVRPTISSKNTLKESNCFDGKDDDLDGKIDCQDKNCNGKQNPKSGGLCEYKKELTCNDAFDNDRDGKTQTNSLLKNKAVELLNKQNPKTTLRITEKNIISIQKTLIPKGTDISLKDCVGGGCFIVYMDKTTALLSTPKESTSFGYSSQKSFITDAGLQSQKALNREIESRGDISYQVGNGIANQNTFNQEMQGKSSFGNVQQKNTLPNVGNAIATDISRENFLLSSWFSKVRDFLVGRRNPVGGDAIKTMSGGIDCADSDCIGKKNADGNICCQSDSHCSNNKICVANQCILTELNCEDNRDNDGDGNLDCSDSDCSGTSKCLVPTLTGEIHNDYIKYDTNFPPLRCYPETLGKVVNVQYGSLQFNAVCLDINGYEWVECDVDGKREQRGEGTSIGNAKEEHYICSTDPSDESELWYYCGNGDVFSLMQSENDELRDEPIVVKGQDFYCRNGKWKTYSAKIFFPNTISNPQRTEVILSNLVEPSKLKGKNVQIQFVSPDGTQLLEPDIDVEMLIDSNLDLSRHTNFEADPYTISVFDLVSSYYYNDVGVEFLRKLGLETNGDTFVPIIVYYFNMDIREHAGSTNVDQNVWNQIVSHDYPLGRWSSEVLDDFDNYIWNLQPTFHEMVHTIHYYLGGGVQNQQMMAQNIGDSDFDLYAEVMQESYAMFFEMAIIDSPHRKPGGFSYDNTYDLERYSSFAECHESQAHSCDHRATILVSALWRMRERFGETNFRGNIVNKGDRLIFETMKYRFHDSPDHFDYGPAGGIHFHCSGPMETMLEMLIRADEVYYNGEDVDEIVESFAIHGIERDTGCVIRS